MQSSLPVRERRRRRTNGCPSECQSTPDGGTHVAEAKTAVVYGAAGAVGAAVARAFAREGAAVFLAGRRLARVQAVAEQIEQAGGTAHAAVVDALDEAAVVAHANAIVERSGQLDISFNAIAVDHIQGVPLSRMTEAEVVGPVARRVATHLLTARAASKHMTAQGRGVIMTFTADAARLALPEVGSFGVACARSRALPDPWRPSSARTASGSFACARSALRTRQARKVSGSSGQTGPRPHVRAMTRAILRDPSRISSTPVPGSPYWAGCRCSPRWATSQP